MAQGRKRAADLPHLGDVVLLVDDDGDTRELHSLMLQLNGYIVFEASDGVEALAILRRVRPHVVLLDLQMPHMNGREFLARFYSRIELCNTPVCIITSEPADRNLRAAAYLQKPILEPELVETVRRLCAVAEAHVARRSA